MKEQDKTPEKQLNEGEIGNLPEKEWISDSEDRMVEFKIGRAHV